MTGCKPPWGRSLAGGVIAQFSPVCKVIVIGGPSEALRDEVGRGVAAAMLFPYPTTATRDMRAVKPVQYTTGVETDAAPRIFSEIWSHEFSFLSGLQNTFASMRNSMEQRCGRLYQKHTAGLPESTGIVAGSNEPMATRAIPKRNRIQCCGSYRDIRSHYRQLAIEESQAKRRTHYGFAIGVWPAISESVSGQSAKVDRRRGETGRTKTH